MKSSSEALEMLCGEALSDFLLLEGGSLALFIGHVFSRDPIETSWELWIESAWRVEHAGQVAVGSADAAGFVCNELLRLRGLPIVGTALSDSGHDIVLRFGSGLAISTFCDSPTGCAWELKGQNGSRYGYGPNNQSFASIVSREEAEAIADLRQRLQGRRVADD